MSSRVETRCSKARWRCSRVPITEQVDSLVLMTPGGSGEPQQTLHLEDYSRDYSGVQGIQYRGGYTWIQEGKRCCSAVNQSTEMSEIA